MIRNVVILLLIMVTFAQARVVTRITLPPPVPTTYNIHVVNGLTNVGLIVHCQSKDNDLGTHNLLNRGDEYQWNFKENIWGTTLFWCRFEKSGAYVSFDSFWPESKKNRWLRERCRNGVEGTCIWTAKEDGIYLFNFPSRTDELVHKWIFT